jgi:hypothetical protein
MDRAGSYAGVYPIDETSSIRMNFYLTALEQIGHSASFAPRLKISSSAKIQREPQFSHLISFVHALSSSFFSAMIFYLAPADEPFVASANLTVTIS